ncbi:MAG: hypothetical protein MK289_04385, partial [Trichodesmium sp. ALOHA_ZT_67]|nr:hypothetical protein [Trichodesmium sp. ALOHA_ZT_67]
MFKNSHLAAFTQQVLYDKQQKKSLCNKYFPKLLTVHLEDKATEIYLQKFIYRNLSTDIYLQKFIYRHLSTEIYLQTFI